MKDNEKISITEQIQQLVVGGVLGRNEASMLEHAVSIYETPVDMVAGLTVLLARCLSTVSDPTRAAFVAYVIDRIRTLSRVGIKPSEVC